MIRILIALACVGLVLLVIQNSGRDELNRRSIERGLEAAKGNVSRPAVPLRPSGDN